MNRIFTWAFLLIFGFGVGMKWKPLDGVFGVKYWERLELRYLHYERNTDLNSDIVSLLINFK